MILPFRRKISLITFWLILSALYAMTFVAAELSTAPVSSWRDFFVLASKWCVISTCSSGLIGVLTLNRIIFAITWPILCIISGIATYFSLSVGASISPGVVELAFANGLSIWVTLVSFKLIVIIALVLASSIVIVVLRWKNVYSTPSVSWITALVSISVITAALNISERIHAAVKARLPYSIYYSVKTYLDNRVEISELRHTYDNVSAKTGCNAPDVYLVLGESLRADHLPQNGYHRNTMPLTSTDSALISYRNIVSDAWFTHASVPIIMTDTDSLTRDQAYSRQSFITLFKKAGYSTAWFANQDFSPSYSYFGHEADTLVYCNNIMSVYTFAKYLDSDILPELKKWIFKDVDKPRLAVLHTIGSHWWYKSHYPDAPDNFTPEIDSHDVGSLSHEQLINSYDNTILETDRFLAGLIECVKDRNSVIIYISDHGENLGEDGMYLHTVGLEPTLRPACMIWYSDQFAKLHPDKTAAIKTNHDVKANTDAIFHTLIDIAGIMTNAYTPSKSLLYEQCSHKVD